MKPLPVSELRILAFNNSYPIELAENKFLDFFGVNHGYCYHNKLYLSIGEGIQHIVKGYLHFFIHGDIYDNLNNIRLFQTEFDEKLWINSELNLINGSFAILVVNELMNSFHIITDRINSKKVYFFKDEDLIFLSTNPEYFRHINQTVSFAGIASYLVNGAELNNHTLFEKTKILERSCLHTFAEGSHIFKPYWKYEFTNEYAHIPGNELKKKFADLLMQGVGRRIHNLKPETCFLSLSGGCDSRFILGALMSIGGGFRLKAFSYGMQEKRPLGDDVIASRLAEKFNFEYHCEQAYSSSLLEKISLNIKYGHGLSNFCDEIDAWLNLSKKFADNPSSLLFVGDMFYPSISLKNIVDRRLILLYSKILPWQHIMPLLSILPVNNKEILIDSYEALYADILKRLPDTIDCQSLKDFIYLDQRISHTLMNWREFFHSPFIKVTTPLLDNDILDFVRKLPAHYRYKKILFKETISDMFPELFAMPIAKNTWKFPSLIHEITINRDEIFKNLESSKSMLDDLIPIYSIKLLINKAIDSDKHSNSNTGFELLQKITKRYDTVNNLFCTTILNNTYIKYELLIIRILVLREALKS